MPLSELGEVLNVAYLVAGNVQRSGSRVRVNVEVLRARDARQLFGDVYDRDRAQLLDVQAEIASAIAGIIAGRLLSSEEKALASLPTRNTDAYEHFLKGNLAYAKRTGGGQGLAAVREFTRAVSLDSSFARAWAALARAHAWVHSYGSDRLVPHDSLARRALSHAARLAPAEATTLHAAGEVAFWTQRQSEARQYLRAALERDSTDAELLLLAANIEFYLGNETAGIALAERAAMMDPRDPAPSRELFVFNAFARRFDDAARYADRLIAQDPEDPDSYFLRAMLRVMRDSDTAAMHADVTRALRRLGAKTLNDAPNWALYPLLRIDSTMMATLDTAIDRPNPELLWMKMQRALAAGRANIALAYADSITRIETSPVDRRGPGATGLWLAEALVLLGRTNEAAALVEKAIRPRPTFYGYEWARILAALGQPERSLDLLEQLLRTPSYTTPALLRVDPGFGSLRAHPRFRNLVETRP